MLLNDLVSYLNDLLDVHQFSDYCPNGLQIEGRTQIKKIMTGVTASQALIDAAIEQEVDALIVHHGYFWKGESQILTGMKGARVKALMQHDISLLAYHLPLDAHPVLGNNAQLAKLLGFTVQSGMGKGDFPVGNVGIWQHGVNQPVDPCAADLAQHISQSLGREAIILGDKNRPIKTLAWCTGAAQSMLLEAAVLGVDCFISGEVSEQTLHIANESDITYIGAGHHATERYGVKALGEYLAAELNLSVVFEDIDNPV
jgi:dinuclear metal center YbgI/SA1388 family protein